MREKSVLAINFVSHAAGNLGGALVNPPHLPFALKFPLILIQAVVGQPTTACDLANKTSPKRGIHSAANVQGRFKINTHHRLCGQLSEFVSK